tara:strand:+ start:140 stop:613 length:474 start_codon:yes stop_codon:yes gene_type:complete
MEPITSGILVSKLLQHELLVKSVNSVASGIISTINHIISNEELDINKSFKQIDLFADLDVITSFVTEVTEIQIVKYSKTVQYCLHNINEILKEISENVEQIKKEITEHKAKYLSSLRSCDFSHHEQEIIEKKKILDKRFDRLLSITGVIKNLSKKTE